MGPRKRRPPRPEEKASPQENPTVIDVRDLVRHFDVSPPLLERILERRGRQWVRAVDGVSLSLRRGETLAVVGESGCGKSTVARLVAELDRPTSGSVVYAGDESGRGRRVQMIFQDPYASLNPRWREGDIIAEPMRVAGTMTDRQAIDDRVGVLLTRVGLSPEDKQKYPHAFSGGQRQRISIARALAGEPEFIICDEPTSALDVSVQAQILNLLRDLQRRLGLTYLFISHDLAVVYHVADVVAVMYLGRVCETSPTGSLFARPRHPYTRLLLDAVPDIEMSGRERRPLTGELPDPINAPTGCAFHPRCPFAEDRCRRERPELLAIDDAFVACHAVAEGRLPDGGSAAP